MAKSTKSRRVNKPAKPHMDFPLFAQANGQRAKKVKGKLHDFGLRIADCGLLPTNDQ